LQDHIAKKILQFSDAMNDKKVLQQFLGIVNYARNYIDNLCYRYEEDSESYGG
jgi:hypothetical protein